MRIFFRFIFGSSFICLIVFGQMYPWVARHAKWVAPKDIVKDSKNNSSVRFTNILNKKKMPFSQLIFSWNALRPKVGFFRFSARVMDMKTRKWLSWHKMFEWGAHIQRSFTGDGKDGSKYHYVRLELDENQLADAFDVKIEALDGARLEDVKFISVTTSCLQEMEAESLKNLKKLATVHIDGVPKKSQMQLEHPDSRRICSPTSTSMQVSYFTGKKLDPVAFAEWSYDQGLQVYGSWPFNVAHAYEHSHQNSINFLVTRLYSFSELHSLLLQDAPVVVSVRGDLKGAPQSYPNGHLLIVVGYDSHKKQVICHDPAQEEDSVTLTRYNLKDFLSAWERSHRLAYITTRR